jgi:hypothetical protein
VVTPERRLQLTRRHLIGGVAMWYLLYFALWVTVLVVWLGGLTENRK